VSLLHAHHVVVTNRRRPVFTDEILTFAENTMRTVCAELDTDLVEFNRQADHLHLLLAYPPTLAISTLVQRLNGRTSYPLRREYTGVSVRARMRAHLCSPSYFTVSCQGAPPLIIKQYTHGQARPP
jgi:putative transposase